MVFMGKSAHWWLKRKFRFQHTHNVSEHSALGRKSSELTGSCGSSQGWEKPKNSLHLPHNSVVFPKDFKKLFQESTFSNVPLRIMGKYLMWLIRIRSREN